MEDNLTPPELLFCGGDAAAAPIQLAMTSIRPQSVFAYTVNAQGQVILQSLSGATPTLSSQAGVDHHLVLATVPATVPAVAAPQQEAAPVTSEEISLTSLPSSASEMSHNLLDVTNVIPQDSLFLKPKTKCKNLGRVRCSSCGKTFSCLANLRDHQRLHTGDKPYHCTECGMSFTQRSNWRLHMRTHTGEKPYMCGICGKLFARSSHLPGHMRSHTGEKPFQCKLCATAFSSQQALKNHHRTHTGERPYVCHSCDTAFTHSSSLSCHKKKCNGVRRKRGRPVGTGRTVSAKKHPSNRPKGRPKKRQRYNRKSVQQTENVKVESSLEIVGEGIEVSESGGEDTNRLTTEASESGTGDTINIAAELNVVKRRTFKSKSIMMASRESVRIKTRQEKGQVSKFQCCEELCCSANATDAPESRLLHLSSSTMYDSQALRSSNLHLDENAEVHGGYMETAEHADFGVPHPAPQHSIHLLPVVLRSGVLATAVTGVSAV